MHYRRIRGDMIETYKILSGKYDFEAVPIFSERERVQVSYMLSPVRLSSVTLVHPTQPVEIFGNFFHHTIGQGLVF